MGPFFFIFTLEIDWVLLFLYFLLIFLILEFLNCFFFNYKRFNQDNQIETLIVNKNSYCHFT